MADQTIPASVRADLEAERDRLTAQIESLVPGSEATAADDNFADSGQVAAEKGEYQALAAQLRVELEEVERALAKLDDGTYGTCETCGQPIAPARLEAMPATRYCIEHA
ncbi:MAG TPA: TraR/DksA C4-type zinc finger protein [Acidimicrobiales bacterium]|nr:TraR/DksA C4-type zinc finger protein [Acidimicrobiales bacterium]